MKVTVENNGLWLNQPLVPWKWVCVCECVRQKAVCACCIPAKLKPHSRWTVWINKCVWHYCSLSFSLSVPLSLCPRLHEGQVMSWLFAFRGLLSGLAAEQIQSCLKVKKLKSPELPPVSLCVWRQEGIQEGRKKRTFKPEEIILWVNIASFFWGCMHAVLTHANTLTLDIHHATQMST